MRLGWLKRSVKTRTWTRCGLVLALSAIDADVPQELPIVALYAAGQSSYVTACPAGRCQALRLAPGRCAGTHARTLILAGHSGPPSYLGLSAQQLAQVVRCYTPELVVLDTCYGATSELLSELASQTPNPPMVVAAPFRVQRGGLRYGPAFFHAVEASQRAAAISTFGGLPLLRWQPERQEIERLAAGIAALSAEERAQRSRVRFTQLIPVPAPGGGELLIGPL